MDRETMAAAIENTGIRASSIPSSPLSFPVPDAVIYCSSQSPHVSLCSVLPFNSGIVILFIYSLRRGFSQCVFPSSRSRRTSALLLISFMISRSFFLTLCSSFTLYTSLVSHFFPHALSSHSPAIMDHKNRHQN